MRHISLLFLGFFLSLAFTAKAQTISVPDYPQPKGVSAPFAGFVGDWLLVGGGCNFPDIPAAEGGTKVFYDDIYAIRPEAGGEQAWTALPPLPRPVAYGASVETPAGLLCIGGQNADGSTAEVYRIEPAGSSFRIVPLPALPVSVDNGAAARLGSKVYVAGGNQGDGGNGLFVLDLDKAGSSWQRLASYPGNRRTQPILLAEGNSLYLIGGFSGEPVSLSYNIIRYSVATDTWTEEGEIVPTADGSPRCLVGGSGVVRDGMLAMTGGVHAPIFQAALEKRAPADYMTRPVSWYRFNADLLLYDPARRTWTVRRSLPGLAKAGGILLSRGNYYYMVCGETKPGVRTPRIVVGQWE